MDKWRCVRSVVRCLAALAAYCTSAAAHDPYMLIQSGEESASPAGIDPAAHTPEAVVSRMKADGMFCVKSFFERGFGQAQNLPVPRLDTMRALVRAAHAAGMPVFLHANGSDAQAFAVEAGVDIVVVSRDFWRKGCYQSQPPVRLTPSLNGMPFARFTPGLSRATTMPRATSLVAMLASCSAPIRRALPPVPTRRDSTVGWKCASWSQPG